jgi:hypothetical protein
MAAGQDARGNIARGNAINTRHTQCSNYTLQVKSQLLSAITTGVRPPNRFDSLGDEDNEQPHPKSPKRHEQDTPQEAHKNTQDPDEEMVDVEDQERTETVE